MIEKHPLRYMDGRVLKVAMRIVAKLEWYPPDQASNGPELPSNNPHRVSEILRTFEASKNEWMTSSHYTELKDVFAHALKPGSVRALTKIVGMSLGPLWWPVDAYEGSELEYISPHEQHALLLGLQRILSEQTDGASQLPCYVQDPINGPTVGAMLGQCGITQLNDPAGLLEVDNGTLLVSIASWICVGQIITDIARPVIFIWKHCSRDSIFKP